MLELEILDYLIVMLLLAGVIFTVMEVFAPGFGIFGILGILSIVLSIFVTVAFHRPATLLYIEIFAIVFSIVLISFVFIKFKGKNGIIHSEVLKPEINDDLHKYLGLQGVSKTVLRPIGFVILNDEQLEAVATVSFIDKEQLVKVVRVTDGKLFVEKV